MGGTSTDVSLIDEKISITTESEIATLPLKVPMIDINTVGAGGGSIVRLDLGGSLRVGPQSAGADPGPICYGKGDQITVTDANLYLGRLIPEYFLGGEMKIYPERLDRYFYDLSKKAKLSPLELAEGIISVANSNMEKAIRRISVERGYDPREFSLFCFGGAGAMHAAYLAKLLNIPRVIVPENPGLLSAMGMLMADVIKDYSVTVMKNQNQVDLSVLEKDFSSIEKQGIEELKKQGIREDQIRTERYLDMRYEGQSYEIIVPFKRDFLTMFHKLHEKLYGYKKTYAQVQIVNLRVRVRGYTEKPTIKKYELWEEKISDRAFVMEKEAIFEGKKFTLPVLKRDELVPGNRIKGPAIVVEYSSTTVIPPFAQAQIDSYGNIIITFN
jgi:N-methylhydantoinase A